jgi:hypothetical protein
MFLTGRRFKDGHTEKIMLLSGRKTREDFSKKNTAQLVIQLEFSAYFSGAEK